MCIHQDDSTLLTASPLNISGSSTFYDEHHSSKYTSNTMLKDITK